MSKKNKKLHFIIFQTTKKPFKFSVNKLLVYSLFPMIIILIAAFSFNIYYAHQKNVYLNNKLAELEQENKDLSYNESLALAENKGLKNNLETKVNQIEKYQSELENLKGAVQNIKEKFNIQDDQTDNTSDNTNGSNKTNETGNFGSGSSRSGFRSMNNQTSNTDNLTGSSENYALIDENDNKDAQLLGEISELKLEIDDLEKSIQDKLDYYRYMPTNFPAYGQISSYYGPRWGSFHRGIDIANSYGSKIYAAGNGTVTECSYDRSYGYYITIQHKYGFSTRYAHLSKINVKVGDAINQCDVIAFMGSTGYSTGTHLHYEIHYYGNYINPLSIDKYLEY